MTDIIEPKSTYSLADFLQDTNEAPRTIKTSKGDVLTIVNDDPPFGLILRLPFDPTNHIDYQGSFQPSAKILFDVIFGEEVYRLIAGDDPAHSLGIKEITALYLFCIFGFDTEHVQRFQAIAKNALPPMNQVLTP